MHIKILTICFIIITFLTTAGCGGGGGGGDDSSGLTDSAIGGSENDPDPVSGSDPDSSYSGSITLEWDSPQENIDGSQLTDLAGYKIYYGTSSDSYTQSIDVGNTTISTIDNLSAGTWCFATTAYNTAGNESDYSNQVCTYI